MQKTILITGSTDGIGLLAAKTLYTKGHFVLVHGRNGAKLDGAEESLSELAGGGRFESYLADFSRMADVGAMAASIREKHDQLDVLVNNAGVFRTADTLTEDGLDIRFAVNTFAPWVLTHRLLPLLGSSARVVNVASAGQSPVNIEALTGRASIEDQYEAYAQSKLALIMWTRVMAQRHSDAGPSFIALNPGSLLATKMVQEGFGMAEKDIRIGEDILVRAALSDEFAEASGKYFDNDRGQFGPPHDDALDPEKCAEVVRAMEHVLSEMDQKAV